MNFWLARAFCNALGLKLATVLAQGDFDDVTNDNVIGERAFRKGKFGSSLGRIFLNLQKK